MRYAGYNLPRRLGRCGHRALKFDKCAVVPQPISTHLPNESPLPSSKADNPHSYHFGSLNPGEDKHRWRRFRRAGSDRNPGIHHGNDDSAPRLSTEYGASYSRSDWTADKDLRLCLRQFDREKEPFLPGSPFDR